MYPRMKHSTAEGGKPETLEKDAPRKDDPITVISQSTCGGGSRS